jgi:hypothetical protein
MGRNNRVPDTLKLEAALGTITAILAGTYQPDPLDRKARARDEYAADSIARVLPWIAGQIVPIARADQLSQNQPRTAEDVAQDFLVLAYRVGTYDNVSSADVEYENGSDLTKEATEALQRERAEVYAESERAARNELNEAVLNLRSCLPPFREAVVGAMRTLLTPGTRVTSGNKPSWDAERRTLTFGGRVVREYRGNPAVNQCAVLAAFEAAGWPPSIIPPTIRPDQIRDTVRGLNEIASSPPPIAFAGDGTGTKIVWSIAPV